ncbi:hypothetical protein ABZZ79_03195 [Streptomyces sp. NPDC006458]|uniref:hypothetical protein n=1 Tax=Streptomyces sp. NPDC006458 TaxID=3154302 RepID=UPI0033B6EB09
MRVLVREALKAYINHQPEDFTPGQEIKGDTAVYLLRNGAAVDPCDDEAEELAQALAAEGQDDEPEETEPDDDQTPAELDITGSVPHVLAWVGEDPERARQALAAELAQDKPRSTLVKQLEKTAEPGQ